MAIVASAEQLAGTHLSIYEEYWREADAQVKGSVAAADAANFLKRSGLSDVILSKIWELSDSGAKGYLDKQGFFCALKLIALVQGGKEASLGNLASSCGPPSLAVAIPATSAAVSAAAVSPPISMGSQWRVTAHEKSKYDGIFQSLQPVNGKLPGDKVKPVLMNSNLPVDVLGKIWDLSDHDKDGQLDAEEFAVAMHLVYQSIEKKPLPSSIPADLIPPSHKSTTAHVPAGAVQVLPVMPTLNTGSSVASEPAAPASWSSPAPFTTSNTDTNHDMAEEGALWIISPQFQSTSDQRFVQLDVDKDGLVNGAEIKDVLLQSGLDQQTLASIWALCDIRHNGFLNREQFALVQWLIEEKAARGRDPPSVLSADMVPPSMRGPADAPSQQSTELSGELLQIEAEIEELKRRKIQLEADKQQRDADLKIRSGEVQTLQKEYDAVNSTTLQLERQRGEAQKKLDELEDQRNRYESEVNELKDKCTEKQQEIDDINQQLAQQDRMEQDQTHELNRLKNEYAELHTEASQLERQIESNTQTFEKLKMEKSSLSSEVTQTEAYKEELAKLNSTIEEALKQYQALINNEDGAQEPDISNLHEPSPLRISQPAGGSNRSSPAVMANNSLFSASASLKVNDFANLEGASQSSVDPFSFSNSANTKADPFASSDPFTSNSDFGNAFGKEEPFKSDPFTKEDPFQSDPFASSDPFKDVSSGGDMFGEDPFKSTTSSVKNPAVIQVQKVDALSRPKSTDPFTSADPFNLVTQPVRSASAVPTQPVSTDGADIFDPFKSTSNSDNSTNNTNDPFGFDPFASTKTEEKKKPPPRPALPRPKVVSPAEGSKPLFNPDPFKMAGNKKKGDRPKMAVPSSDAFADAFSGNDPFAGASNGTGSKSGDPFTANFADFGNGFETGSSGKDLEWATQDSEEAERKKRLAEQEKADFEFALALSKAES